ncbi:MAG: hypothetical protein J3R72DRAFT_22671 [Linnemannia gamsii]|nr:MAG: hypothetical protein J3R72DRAFT_22671 [Linnemannia gamsii]
MSSLFKSTYLAVIATFLLLSLSLLSHTNAAPTKNPDKRLMLPLAPLASAVNGASIILENDVDSSKVKHSFLLLSQPRGYYAGMDTCLSMGDGKSCFCLFKLLIVHPSLVAETTSLSYSTRWLHLHPRNSGCY